MKYITMPPDLAISDLDDILNAADSCIEQAGWINAFTTASNDNVPTGSDNKIFFFNMVNLVGVTTTHPLSAGVIADVQPTFSEDNVSAPSPSATPWFESSGIHYSNDQVISKQFQPYPVLSSQTSTSDILLDFVDESLQDIAQTDSLLKLLSHSDMPIDNGLFQQQSTGSMISPVSSVNPN